VAGEVQTVRMSGHEDQGVLYHDRWIDCTETELRIRGYYFPWGTKRIAYSSIRGLRRVEMGPLTGRGRIWGTASPRYWASFDPARPRKSAALIVDLGKRTRPFVTPDDPDAVEAIIRQRTALPPGDVPTPPGPVV
jgi:hypothetical protein